jgi:hypothetical protein
MLALTVVGWRSSSSATTKELGYGSIEMLLIGEMFTSDKFCPKMVIGLSK